LDVTLDICRTVLERSPSGVFIAQDGALAFANPRLAEIHGYASVQEMLGLALERLVHPEDRELVLARARQRQEGVEVPAQYEFRGLKADGSTVWLEVHSLRGRHRGRPAVVGHVLDVSERRRARRVLAESEERYRLLAENMSDLVCLHDGRGRVVYCSPSVRRVLGVGAEELVRGLPPQRVHPQDRAKFPRQAMDQALAGRRSPASTYRWRRHRQGWVWLETLAEPVLGPGGQVEGAVTTTREVTDRVAASQALRQSERKFRAIFEQAGLGLGLADAEARLLDANQELCRLMGRGRQGLEGRSLWELLHPEDQDGASQAWQELLAESRESLDLEERLEREDGSWMWARLTASLVRRGDGEPPCLLVVVEDITGRKAFEHQQQMVAKVFQNSVEGIILADAGGQVQMVNPAFTAITGYQPQEVVGREMNVLRAESHGHHFYQEVWDQLTEEGQWSGEYWNRRKNGEAYPEWLTISVIRRSSGEAAGYMAIFHDITEIKRSQEQIQYQAHHDALTGLPNRVLLDDRLGQALQHSRRSPEQVAVLFMDLDNFKRINDSLGHEVGDDLLRQVARRLEGCVRGGDTVARLGGDEFILVLTEVTEQEQVVQVARRVLESLAEPFRLAGHKLAVGASIGITLHPQDGDEPGVLIKNADMAMYRAKEEGKNAYQFFTGAMQDQANRRLTLENALRRGLEGGELVVHYQPRVELASGRVVGMEALVRWDRPGQGLAKPSEFISVAEDSGLIVPLGRLVLETACRQALSWQGLGRAGLVVSVNLSPRQLFQGGLVALLEEVLGASGLPPELLELELTETTMMREVEGAVELLGQVDRLGVGLAVDDFGTGYSSLYYLKHFPLHTLKVDRSFIRDLHQDPNDAAIVAAVISMGRAMGLTVVAEGVETAFQEAYLRRQGCHQAQGYLFSRPLSAQEAGRLLARQQTACPGR
jgi:diguanylate cyclase (GGDEF)-like protein/PAS domain S-box-containing protein